MTSLARAHHVVHSGSWRPTHRCRQAGHEFKHARRVHACADCEAKRRQAASGSPSSGRRVCATCNQCVLAPHAGSVAVKDLFTPAELPPGAKLEVIVLRFRASGPTLSPVTPQLRQAFDQTFQVWLAHAPVAGALVLPAPASGPGCEQTDSICRVCCDPPKSCCTHQCADAVACVPAGAVQPV